MKNKLLLLFTVLIYVNSFAQKSLWTKTSEDRLQILNKMERSSMPKQYELFSLDFSQLKLQLLNAPLDSENNQSNLIISFPNPNGKLVNYRIYESPIMEKGLADKFPGLKTYSGKNIENPAESIRFSVTVFGLHFMSLTGEKGTFYIDTYTKDLNNYIIYTKQNIVPTTNFECHVLDNSVEKTIRSVESNISNRASDSFFRTYRLAMACTTEYAAFHVNAAGLSGGTLTQKKAAVLSAMIVTMARVNGVFETDLSLRMNLVANNDFIIFIDSDDFDNSNTNNALLNQSQTVIDATIGSSNYDIGHTVSTGGGGVAQLQSPCGSGKARGITGQGSPVGDTFDIDFVAHEMGHQWGANHTQNNACNRNSATAVEPGSGSTIMSYAGICAPNIQANSDALFHAISIAEIVSFITGTGGNCAVAVPNGNSAPVVNAGIDYTIPKGTAFILKGSATDANGDTLTYCWEQTNNQTSTQPPTQTATVGPNFRSLPPSLSPDRYMPTLSSVVAGVLNPTWEVVPTVARTLNFALTVRDNKIVNGGQTGRDDNVITVNGTAGPFLVSSPNTVVSFIGNTSQTITWAVAGTTANGVNCANVEILLSTNGGVSFPITLLAGTPNDGTQALTIPNLAGTTNRIMIKGSNHIFYDVSNTNFTITTGTPETSAPTAPTLSASGTTQTTTILSWTGATDNVAVTSYNIYQNGILVGTTNVSSYTVIGLNPATVYAFTVKAKDADGNLSISSNNVNVTTQAPDTTSPTPPTLSASGTTSSATNLSWTGATDNIAVTGYNIYQGVTQIGTTTTAITFTVTGLNASTTYSFTIKAKDGAGNLSVSSNIVNVITQAPDTIPPTAPILVAIGSNANATTLSWSGSTDNIAVTGYDVYQGAILLGSTIAAITTINVTGLLPLSTYSFTVRAKDAAGNISVPSNTVTITTFEFNYCASQGNSVADELIGNVQIGTINNSSSGGSGYTNFSAISTNMTLGSSQTITITPTWTGTVYPEGYAVFIDYNRDGDFTDLGETVWSNVASTTTPISGTFTVPITATLGITRMRVSLKYNGIPTACELFGYGQVEDYTVVLVGSNTTISTKLFIEGYYNASTNEMRTVLANQGIGFSITNVDEVTLELRNPTTLALAATTTAMLQTDGIANCIFNSVISGAYYLVVKHRNSIQTWSTNPVTITPTTSYDFTDAITKAFGSNMIQLETGVFGFYSGDINQDGFIEGSDFPTLLNDSDNLSEGYFTTDLNGDGFVEGSDFPILLNNSDNLIESVHP